MPHGTMFLSFTIFYLPSFSTFLDSSLQDSTLANANFLSFLSLIRLLLGFVGFDLMAFFLMDELEYMIDDDFDMAEFEDDDPFEEQNQKLTIGDASDSEDDDDLDKVFFFFFVKELKSRLDLLERLEISFVMRKIGSFIDLQTKQKNDTSALEARNGKDIQGIPWESLNFTRENYRERRLKQYKNYENLSRSRKELEKVSFSDPL